MHYFAKFSLTLLAVCGAPIFAAPAFADNYATQSGRVLCVVTPDPTIPGSGDLVGCQGPFAQSGTANNVVTNGDGVIRWISANIATDNPTTKMQYGQTYRHGNWMIYPDQTGTRFTDNKTGHGMFVSIENVYAF